MLISIVPTHWCHDKLPICMQVRHADVVYGKTNTLELQREDSSKCKYMYFNTISLSLLTSCLTLNIFKYMYIYIADVDLWNIYYDQYAIAICTQGVTVYMQASITSKTFYTMSRGVGLLITIQGPLSYCFFCRSFSVQFGYSLYLCLDRWQRGSH